MIIECPSCKTKFSVDAAQMRNVKHPRFHCSRCDHFFEHSESLNEAKTASKSAKPAEPGPAQLPLLPEAKSSKSRTAAALGDRPEKDENFGITADWPDKSSTEPHAADLRQALALSMVSKNMVSRPDERSRRVEEHVPAQPTASWTTPENSAPAARSSGDVLLDQIESHTEIIADDTARRLAALRDSSAPAARPFAEEPVDHPVIAPSGGEPRSLEFEPAARPPLQRLRDLEPAIDSTTVGREKKDDSQTTDSSSFSRAGGWRKPGEKPRPPAAAYVKSSTPLTWRPLAAVLSFPTLLCLAVLVWSINIGSTPTAVKSMLNLETSSLPRVPPAGVQLIDLSSELITLDDGKRVLQVSGNVFNGTADPVKDIKVEARLYDQANHQLKNIVTNSANGLLSAARLGSLNEDTLRNLQRKSVVPVKELAPNEREPFKVIFTAPLEKAAWYTARVYSVRLS